MIIRSTALGLLAENLTMSRHSSVFEGVPEMTDEYIVWYFRDVVLQIAQKLYPEHSVVLREPAELASDIKRDHNQIYEQIKAFFDSFEGWVDETRKPNPDSEKVAELSELKDALRQELANAVTAESNNAR